MIFGGKFLDQKKQAKLQSLQDSSKVNWDNMNKVRLEASRHLRNKKEEYLAMKSKNIRDLYTGINEFNLEVTQ
jgi:hypothetical protein